VTSSREVSRPFSVSPHRAAASIGRAFHTRSPAPSGFLNLMTPSSAPVPGGLVSCHIRSWGCTLQSFVPPVQPYAVSGAAPLLSLDEPGFPLHARSHRAETRRPHAPSNVLTGRSLLRPTRPRDTRPKPAATGASPLQPAEADCTARLPERPRERPRLQGFAPHESPLLTAGGLDRRRARGSLGLEALQGVLPRWIATAFTAAPLMGFPARMQATERPALQGLASSEIGLPLSRLPALLGFRAF
jgi:hypothetical protein